MELFFFSLVLFTKAIDCAMRESRAYRVVQIELPTLLPLFCVRTYIGTRGYRYVTDAEVDTNAKMPSLSIARGEKRDQFHATSRSSPSAACYWVRIAISDTRCIDAHRDKRGEIILIPLDNWEFCDFSSVISASGIEIHDFAIRTDRLLSQWDTNR